MKIHAQGVTTKTPCGIDTWRVVIKPIGIIREARLITCKTCRRITLRACEENLKRQKKHTEYHQRLVAVFKETPNEN